MEDKIFEVLVDQEDITWKSLMLDIIKQEGMTPWDVDVSSLSRRYIERVKNLQNSDLKIGGKVLLAAAILLRIKSKRLVGEDLDEFDRLIAQNEATEDEFYSELEGSMQREQLTEDQLKLIPKTPQPRQRKVSIMDLVNALEKALETKKRRLIKKGVPEATIIYPHQKLNINLAIKKALKEIKVHFINKNERLFYTDMVPQEANKLEKVHAFIPLLHLNNEREIDLEQGEDFGPIEIKLPRKKA